MNTQDLNNFVVESWRIEGKNMMGDAYIANLAEIHQRFLEIPAPDVEDLSQLAFSFAGAVLRDEDGMDVTVGKHRPPPGGPQIAQELNLILACITTNTMSPWDAHRLYEKLHPLTDGNGRTGRLLWLWHMKRDGQLDQALRLGFLHAWYYQSLG